MSDCHGRGHSCGCNSEDCRRLGCADARDCGTCNPKLGRLPAKFIDGLTGKCETVDLLATTGIAIRCAKCGLVARCCWTVDGAYCEDGKIEKLAQSIASKIGGKK